MKSNPLVTICFLTYNSEDFLVKALSSIINQSYQNFEILVSDSGSTDKTREIIQSFQKQSSKIILRDHIKKIEPGKFYDGNYDNCNTCIKSGLVKGEFVGFYHSDDVYHKDIIKKEVDFLENNPEAAAVFTLGNLIDESDKIIGQYKLPEELTSKNIFSFPDVFKAILNHGNTFLLTPTFMARREIFEDTGLFHTEGLFGLSGDLEMWLRILEKHPVGIINDKLINRRVGGAGKKYDRKRTEQAGFFKVMDYYLESKNYITKADKKSLRQYRYQKNLDNTLIARNLIVKGNFKEARRMINKSFPTDHFLAFFENMSVLRTKVLALQLFIFITINLGLGRQVGKILKRI